MNLLESVHALEPRFHCIRRMPLENAAGQTVAWNAYAYDKSDLCLAGGTAADFTTALRICVAELLERRLVAEIPPMRAAEFKLDSHPTTCGFAAGFSAAPTASRSLCEAIERWAWSKWIDEGFRPHFLDDHEIPKTPVMLRHLQDFTETVYVHQQFEFHGQQFQLGVVIGLTDTGAFAGSRVCTSMESPWEHAAIEAYRSLRNTLNHSEESILRKTKNVAWHRTLHFATRREEALRQVYSGKKSTWPTLFTKNFHRGSYDTGVPGLFLFRSLFTDYIPWNEGPISRFVY